MWESPTAAEDEMNPFFAAGCVAEEGTTVSMMSGDTFYVIRRMPSTLDSQEMETGQIPVVMSSPRMNIYAMSLTDVDRCSVLSFMPKIFTSSMLCTATGTTAFVRSVFYG